jgi:hypothetical protein
VKKSKYYASISCGVSTYRKIRAGVAQVAGKMMLLNWLPSVLNWQGAQITEKIQLVV